MNAASLGTSQTEACFEPLTLQNLDAVLVVEYKTYAHPWSRGNFTDSLASGYQAQVLLGGDAVLGYFVAMLGVDEAHLLNVAVSAEKQGQGLGRFLLNQAVACARGLGMASVLLEVRPSNERALDVYQRYGFVQIGRRKAYYPAANQTREDAIVMRICL